MDVVISGSINFSNNLTYWLEDGSQFILAYRNLSTWWQWGGTDVNIYGGGVINGNGQAWWDELVVNSSISRPLLFVVNNMHGGSISNLKMVNAPDVGPSWPGLRATVLANKYGSSTISFLRVLTSFIPTFSSTPIPTTPRLSRTQMGTVRAPLIK